MRRQIFRAGLLCALTTGLCHAGGGLANGGVTIEMDFGGTPGAHLSFSGNSTFSLTPDASGHEFEINNVSGGTGDALGLFGTISGTFTIGAIQNNEAPVTGNGLLSISDGSHSLTADISLLAIDKPNWLGTLNPNEVVNLSNVHYAGSNKDLMTFASAWKPTALVSFFDMQTLTALTSGHIPSNAGFSGSLLLSAPEPSTLTLFLGSVSLIGGLRFAGRRRKTAGASAGR